jgi:hypothetical protein
MKVCIWPDRLFAAPSGILNCGKCEKCIRTMTELVACGALKDSPAFPCKDVSPELVSTLVLRDRYKESYYQDLIEPLRSQGRDDLVRAIRRVIARSRLRRGLKTLDARLLHGMVLRAKRTLRKKTR